MIIIVDYKMGNLGSIANMLKKIGHESTITSNIKLIEKADKIILPGVGAFDKAMSNLKELNLIEILNEKVLEQKIPVLGICLGMQLLTNRSEEGSLSGLVWIDADVVRFRFDEKDIMLKVPHMGWNTINVTNPCKLFDDMYENTRFYFVHSYHAVCKHGQNVLTTTHYGYEFTSSIIKDNIIGVQFHPEKSHKFGMKLLQNFIEKY